MTADGDRQPIRRRRRMAFPRALRYGENGRSGTPGGVGDGLSRRAPRAVTFAEEAHRSLCRRPGRRWTHGWRGAERSSSTVDEYHLPSLWLTPSPPDDGPIHPDRPGDRVVGSSPRYSARWAQNSSACPAARMAAASHRTTTPSSSCAVVVVVAAERQPPSPSRRRSRRRRTDSSCAFGKRSVVRRAAILPISLVE